MGGASNRLRVCGSHFWAGTVDDYLHVLSPRCLHATYPWWDGHRIFLTLTLGQAWQGLQK